LASHPRQRAQTPAASRELTEVRELLQRSEPAARRETNSSAGSTCDLALFSLDEQQTCTVETIEIQEMVDTYRTKVIETPDDE
jgi:hypothetical protein